MKIFNKFINKTNLSQNRQKVAKNLYWALLGKTINIFGGLLVGIIVARYLGPEQYGLMNYVISYVTLFSILATFGLDNIEIRELSKNTGQTDIILGTVFVLHVIFALLTIVLIIITLFLFKADVFTSLLIFIYSFSLIFSTFNIIRNYFTAIVLNEFVVKTEIFRTIIGALLKIGLLLVHASLIWFVVAITFDFILIAGGYVVSYKKKVGPIKIWKYDKQTAKYLLHESFPLLLSGTVVIIFQKIDQLMIQNMLGSKALGQYAVTANISALISFFPQILAQTVTPLLVQVHQKDLIKYREKRQQFMDIMFWCTILISLLVSLMSYWVIKILYGEQYMMAVPVLKIMAWNAVGMAIFLASGQLIILEGLQKYAVFRNLLGCFICVATNMLLIPKYGIMGSAVASVISLTFIGFISHLFIHPFRHLFYIQLKSLLFPFQRNRLKNLFKLK